MLDGDVLGDPAWADAAPMSGFWQEQPFEGQPSTERTEVRMIVTADTLYVGVVCYDSEPAGIIVSDARRDAPLDETDSFRLILDTYRDRQNGFVFGTNPAGIEYDGQVTNEGQGGGGLSNAQMQMGGSGSGFNLNWDGAWQVRARISEVGWSAEFAIPVQDAALSGRAARRPGASTSSATSAAATSVPTGRRFRGSSRITRVSLAGAVERHPTCPRSATSRPMPYVLGKAMTSRRAAGADTTGSATSALDVKYNLTPSLTLDATVNTDFAQVEVDDQQVNLDRFNLFFPEKRPFFLENAGFFAVGNPGEVDLFFSRRIGIDADGRADAHPRRRARVGQGRRVEHRPAQHADRRLDRRPRLGRAEQQLRRRPRQPRTAEPIASSACSFTNRAGIRATTPRPRRLQPHLCASTAAGASACRRSSPASSRAHRRRAAGRPTRRSTCDRAPTPAASTSTSATRRWASDFNPEVGFLTRARLPQARRPRHHALPSEGSLGLRPAGDSAACLLPQLLGLRRLPGDDVHAPRHALAVPQRVRGAHRA